MWEYQLSRFYWHRELFTFQLLLIQIQELPYKYQHDLTILFDIFHEFFYFK